MQHEEIINCPKSGGDLCYKVQVAPEIYNYMSLSCGFWTNSFMTEDHEFYMQQMETLPELYKDLAWKDPQTGLIWLPNTINNTEQGMIFANGSKFPIGNGQPLKQLKSLKKNKRTIQSQVNLESL
jgi:hypothetical protein